MTFDGTGTIIYSSLHKKNRSDLANGTFAVFFLANANGPSVHGFKTAIIWSIASISLWRGVLECSSSGRAALVLGSVLGSASFRLGEFGADIRK